MNAILAYFSKTKEKLSYSQLIFIIVFLCLFPKIYIGLDVTDFGFHIMQQKKIVSEGFKSLYFNPFFPLTDYLSGAWIYFTQPLGLIGIRLGGVFVYSFSSAILIELFEPYIKDKRLLLVSILAVTLFILYYSGPALYMHYYNVPMLISLFFIAHNFSFYKNPTILKACFIGFCIPLLFFIRFTLIGMGVLPMIGFIINSKPKKLQLICLLYGIAFITFFVLLFVIYSNGIYFFKVFIESLNPPDSNQAITSILQLYMAQAVLALKQLLGVGLVCFCLYLINKKAGALILFFYFLVRSLTTIVWALQNPPCKANDKLINQIWNFLPDFFKKQHHLRNLEAGLFFAALLLVSYLMLSLFFNKKRTKEIRKELLFLYLSGLILPILLFLGSSDGLVRIVYGCGIVFILLVILSQDYFYPKPHFFYFIVSFALIFMYGIYHENYRDTVKFSKFDQFTDSPLKGIITYAPRKKVLVELLNAMSQYANKNDYIIAYHYIPMLYYISETRPLFDFCWPCLADRYIKNELIKLENKPLPKLIVKAKFDANDFSWPNISMNTKGQFDKKIEMLERGLKERYAPVLVWSNSAFDIFLPQKIHNDTLLGSPKDVGLSSSYNDK